MEDDDRRRSRCRGGPRAGKAAARHGGGAVQRKVRELRRLVPGGRKLPAEQLLQHTADYIFQLRLRVQVLRALSSQFTQ